MNDKADPLDGWPIREVARVRTMAKEDLYGKLYIYLRRVFQQFLDRLGMIEIDFELLNMNAVQLPETLQENKYARIEVRGLKHAGKVPNGAYRHRTLLMPGIWAHEKPCAYCPLCCNPHVIILMPRSFRRI